MEKSSLLVVQKVIDAPPDRVWTAWTNPDDLQHWFTSYTGEKTEVIQFDMKVDGKVRLKFPGAAGEYTWTFVKIDKPNLLIIDILDFSLPEHQGEGGICNVSFKDLDGRTEVTVSGELPPEMDNDEMRNMAEKGWGGTLDRLNNYLKEK